LEIVFRLIPIYLDTINCPTIARKLVKLIFTYFTTIPDGGCAGYVVVVAQDMWWVAGLNENKANSAS
jgi:hypothetical protein